MHHRIWTREETLAAFNLYCRTPFGRLHTKNLDIIELAQQLGRSANSVAMKCCNLASFDPALKRRGIKGLQSASRLDRQIWTEFEQDPETIGYASAQALARMTQRPVEIEEEVEWQPVVGLERETITRIRVNQRLFRTMVMVGYGSRCAVCRLQIPALLVASHIVPWSLDPTQRMNPCNGLCLCSLHDKAFDTGYMVIDADLRVWVAPENTGVCFMPPP
jgi:putative restriction endonuclease